MLGARGRQYVQADNPCAEGIAHVPVGDEKPCLVTV